MFILFHIYPLYTTYAPFSLAEVYLNLLILSETNAVVVVSVSYDCGTNPKFQTTFEVPHTSSEVPHIWESPGEIIFWNTKSYEPPFKSTSVGRVIVVFLHLPYSANERETDDVTSENLLVNTNLNVSPSAKDAEGINAMSFDDEVNR